MSAPVIINGNPNTYPLTGLPAGAMILDMTGAVPGVALVVRSGPTTNSRYLLASTADLGGTDTVEVSESSSGAGVRSLAFSVKDSAGDARVGAPFEVILVSDDAVNEVTITAGNALVIGSTNQRLVKGVTNDTGGLTVRIATDAGVEVGYFANSVSATPGSLGGSTVVP